MSPLLRTLLCAICMLLPIALEAAEVRTFREANGRTHTGTFQKVQGDKVHVRVRNKTSQLSFWALSKADQLYVLEQTKSDPLVASTLKPAEDPREWTDSRGNKTSARFVDVKAGGVISLIIDGNRAEFPFGNFSQPDKDYIRNQVRGTAAAQHLPEEVAAPGGANPVGQVPMNPVAGQPGFPAQVPMTTPNFPGSVPMTSPFPMPSSTPMPMPSPFPMGHAAVPTTTNNIGTPGLPMPTSSVPMPTGGHDAVAMNPPGMSSAMPSSSVPMNSGSIGHNPAPSFTPPPSSPQVSNLGTGRSDMVTEFACSNCKKSVSSSALSCPHCHVTFDYVENADGSRTTTGIGAAKMGWAGFRVLVLIVIPFLCWLGKKVMNHD